jgi:hypothetical protein
MTDPSTYGQPDGIEPLFDDPLPILLGDPIVPMPLERFPASPLGYIVLQGYS